MFSLVNPFIKSSLNDVPKREGSSIGKFMNQIINNVHKFGACIGHSARHVRF